LAGPVVAGACHIPCSLFLRKKGRWSPFLEKQDPDCIIADSKALEAEEREATYTWLTTHCAWGVGMADAAMIDRIGILEATQAAMQQALAMLAETITPTYLLVDGRDAFWFDYPHSSIIRGDSLEPAIAAASILAKVTRDRLMIEVAKDLPHYGFEGHKGYASPTHIAAIKEHGASAMHRKSFLTRIIPVSQ